MIISGHQPAYLPWLGLLHKASLADVFVYMDDVQFLKDDFIHRNRIKTSQGGMQWLTLPVDVKGSDSDRICDIRLKQEVAGSKEDWQRKHWLALKLTYGKAPYFAQYAPFFESLYEGKRWELLSDLNFEILKQALEWFGITTRVVKGSQMEFTQKKSDLVLEHALKLDGKLVVTGKMGVDYIQKADFDAKGIQVYFQDYQHPTYSQRFGDFIPNLSFVDLLFQEGPKSAEIAFSGNIKKKDLL